MSIFQRLSTGLLPLVAVVLGLTISGCNGQSNGNGDQDTHELRSCNVDAECQSGFVCDRELRRCVCTSDAACLGGLFCNAFTGRCVEDVPGCTSDAACEANQYCDVPTRTCRARRAFCEPCEADIECGGASDQCVRDETVNRRYCGQSCSTDTECPDGALCQSVNGYQTCWPAVATCEQLKGCNPNSSQACTESADCTEGEDQVCDQVQGICVARVPTCPFGMVCGRDSQQCEAACITDDDCNADPDCGPESPCRCTNNECVPISLCAQDQDCEPGRLCVIEPGHVEGECRPDCQGDSSLCPQGTLCRDRGSRYECVTGCQSNADCTVSENCIGSECVGTSTSGDQYCQMPEVCDLCEACQDDGAGGRTCQTLAATCQVCSVPAGQCTGSAPSFCCAIFTSTGYRGIDCSGGRLCPAGHQCVELNVSGTLYHNCFPTSDSVCASPSCQ
jgi:hypothetical protein